MALVSTTLVVSDDALPANLLEDVTVRYLSEDGLTLVTQGITDANGELTLDLEDVTTYWVRFFKLGYAFPTRLFIDVDSGASSNIFDATATDLQVLPPSTVPYLCKASGYVRGGDLAPKPGISFTFSLTGRPRVVGGQAMIPQDLIAKSDADGWLEVELVRGGVYDLVIAGMDDTVYRVVIPDRTSIELTQLIWPYAATLEYSATSATVAVGESVEVTATVTLSSGVQTPYTLDDKQVMGPGNFVRFFIADGSIIDVNVSTDGTVTLTGKKAGTTTITSEVVPDVEAIHFPEPTRDFASLVVTVTP